MGLCPVWDGRTVTNDGRFPDDQIVAVAFPMDEDSPRDAWPWCPGIILAQVGINEWRVQVQVPGLATIDPEGKIPAPVDAPLEDVYWPNVYRGPGELSIVPQEVSK